MAHLLGRAFARLVSNLTTTRPGSTSAFPTPSTPVSVSDATTRLADRPSCSNSTEPVIAPVCCGPCTSSAEDRALPHHEPMKQESVSVRTPLHANACPDTIVDSFEVVTNELESVASFAKDEVLQLAQLASAAYLPSADLASCRTSDANLAMVEPGVQLRPNDQIHPFEGYSSQGFVVTRGKEVIIAFKGTSTLYDLFVTDFNALPMFPGETLLPQGGFVHAGFLAAFKSSWPQLRGILDDQVRRQGLTSIAELERVTVTGHSLGGALATLAVLHLAHHARQTASSDALLHEFTKNRMRLCTFGSPRVLSIMAARYFNEVLCMGARTLRVAENGVDVVTMVAPGSLGYCHVGINLAIQRQDALPHVMTGYHAGVLMLKAATFVPLHYVGVRRRLIHTCLALCRLRRPLSFSI